jgi:hypothetical protein
MMARMGAMFIAIIFPTMFVVVPVVLASFIPWPAVVLLALLVLMRLCTPIVIMITVIFRHSWQTK